MFKVMLISIVLLLFVGAIRRWFFGGAWRLVLPLFVGFLIGVPIAQKLLARGGAPREAVIILPFFASFLIAAALKTALDEITRPPKR